MTSLIYINNYVTWLSFFVCLINLHEIKWIYNLYYISSPPYQIWYNFHVFQVRFSQCNNSINKTCMHSFISLILYVNYSLESRLFNFTINFLIIISSYITHIYSTTTIASSTTETIIMIHGMILSPKIYMSMISMMSTWTYLWLLPLHLAYQ